MDGIINIESFRKLGKLLADVHAIESDFPEYLDHGKMKKGTHSEFIIKQIEYGKQRAIEKNTDLSNEEINSIERICAGIASYIPEKYSLLHGDLHLNNVLLKGTELYLFDVSSTIRYGDPYRDLALFAISFPNGSYIAANDSNCKKDKDILEGIMSGYGDNFLQSNKEIIDRYVLLKCFVRYPNPFETHLKDIIQNLIKKYT